jgi:DNA-directed RNA polymerase subunit H (RpoH/RPB5)
MQRAIATSKIMMEARGFSFSSQETISLIGMIYPRHIYVRGEEYIHILYVTIDSISINFIKDILSNTEIQHFILIYSGKITAPAKNLIQMISLKYELFHVNELQHDLNNHFMVPKIEKTAREMKEKLLRDFGRRIPKFLISDPLCKFYGFEKDDVITIYRWNGEKTYRIIE